MEEKEEKGEKGLIILGLASIIAIVIMILLVKSVSTGQTVLKQPFTMAQTCEEMPDMARYLHLSRNDCVTVGRMECTKLAKRYGWQATPTSPIGFCHDQCNNHVANGCRYAGSILGKQNIDPRNWQD